MSSARAAVTKPKVSIDEIRALLHEKMPQGAKLLAEDQVRKAPGLATGWSALDQFSASGGFPCGEIVLLESPGGLGATTLWLEAAARVTNEGRRAAWLNPSEDVKNLTHDWMLHAPTAAQRGIRLENLFLVDDVPLKKRLWILQELLTSNLFALVGCDLGGVHLPLREARSLLAQARRSGAAVVLFSRDARMPAGFISLTSLVLDFRNHETRVLRASHRPVPQTLHRRTRHVEFISGSLAESVSGSAAQANGSERPLDPSFILSAGGAAHEDADSGD